MLLNCKGTEAELTHFLFEELSDEEFDPVVLPMIRVRAGIFTRRVFHCCSARDIPLFRLMLHRRGPKAIGQRL